MSGIALVTGANKGIGLEVVRQLAARGWTVFLTARQLPSSREGTNGHPFIRPVLLDVTKPDTIAAAVSTVSRTVDHLDVLINNAGILDPDDASVITVPAERLRRMFETNTIGPLRVTQAFLPLLRNSSSMCPAAPGN